MTKLILVRHGHVRGISPERFRGRAELPLTELGRREAELTAAQLKSSQEIDERSGPPAPAGN